MRSLIALALAVPLFGCGLVDPNITNFDLAYNTGAQRARRRGGTCAMGACIAQCNATSLTCDLTLFVSLFTPVDLLVEKPELATIQDEPLIDVTIDAITYKVMENSLNVATPEMKVYAAPMTVIRAGDPLAREIGTVPAIPAGMTMGETDVVLSPTGKATLAEFMGDFKTPFNIIVGSNLMVQQGDAVPMGKLVVNVGVKAHAGV